LAVQASGERTVLEEDDAGLSAAVYIPAVAHTDDLDHEDLI
jgi:hypothetical protein